MIELEYVTTLAFEKDFKSLLKKYRSLVDDLERVKTRVIEAYHLKSIDSDSVKIITKANDDQVVVCKIRKFGCKSLPNRGAQSGIREAYLASL